MRHGDDGAGFIDTQRRFFQEADAGHFSWQTTNPYFSRTERELLACVCATAGARVLEVGCGEGGNLINLFGSGAAMPRVVVGLDLSPRKLVFARGQSVPGAFVCGDATNLPFRTGTFDVVLCRDLLHHLQDPEPALKELGRVAGPRGVVWVVEPNGRNPLIRLFALARRHERGQLRNSVASLTKLVGRHFAWSVVEVRQPLPVYRVLLHYQFGLPRLGCSRLFGAVMNGWEGLARRVVPRDYWAYVVAQGRGTEA